MKGHPAKGHVRKHTKAATHKHHAKKAKHHPVHHAKTAAHKTKHHVHAKAKHPAHAKAVGLALDGVACCGAEALAASLRIQGLAVADAAVLDLFRAAGGDEDKGLPILEALEAAARVGLAEYRPVFAEHPLEDLPLPFGQLLRHVEGVDLGEVDHDLGVGPLHSLILGVNLPGPHAVLATPEGWWSWGELWCPWCEFPDAVIEEAWAVTWA